LLLIYINTAAAADDDDDDDDDDDRNEKLFYIFVLMLSLSRSARLDKWLFDIIHPFIQSQIMNI
jgi:hypothetical protein